MLLRVYRPSSLPNGVTYALARSPFQHVRATVCQLTSSDWCSISELIARTLLSHWNVTHLLRRLYPWLEGDQDGVRIRVPFQNLFRAVFDCSRLSREVFLLPVLSPGVTACGLR